MLTLIDIKQEIMKKLDATFPGHVIYGEEVKQGMKKPCFFVEIIPVRTINEQFYKVKNLIVKVNYFSMNETNEENHLMTDQLEQLFALTLKVNDRFLAINEVNPVITDFLQFGFNLSVINGVELVTITNIHGEEQSMLPTSELGYSQDKLSLIDKLELNKEVK